MEIECPKDCLQKHAAIKKRVDGHDKTLYGEDGAGGVVARGSAFVKKSVMLVVSLSLIGSMVAIGIWAADNKSSVADAIANNKASVMVNQANIANINANIADIKKQIESMSETQKVILENQIKAINEMHKIVREAIIK